MTGCHDRDSYSGRTSGGGLDTRGCHVRSEAYNSDTGKCSLVYLKPPDWLLLVGNNCLLLGFRRRIYLLAGDILSWCHGPRFHIVDTL